LREEALANEVQWGRGAISSLRSRPVYYGGVGYCARTQVLENIWLAFGALSLRSSLWGLSGVPLGGSKMGGFINARPRTGIVFAGQPSFYLSPRGRNEPLVLRVCPWAKILRF